ncbi:MAG: prepilin-type N-terminal cleavage/methylation domain-containing protein [Candidatus Gottesmanbacteria bacterium]
MITFTKKNRQGFTLLELLVSASVLSLVSVIIAQVLFTTVRLNTKTELLKEMKQTGTASVETIRRMIQNAQNISSACTGSVQSELTITNVGGGQTTFRCLQDITYETRSVYRIASESATPPTSSYISSGNVTLVDGNGEAGCGLPDSDDAAVRFICSSVGGKATSITILFRLRQQNPRTGVFEGTAEMFQSTGTTRNK